MTWTLLQGDCLEIMPTLPSESIDMVFADPPYGHKNHDGDWNARLNDHRGIENKPICNDDPEAMRYVVDGMFLEAVRVLKHDCCCCCCCCCGGGGPKPTFAWVADRMDREGLAFFHAVVWDKKNPGLGWRYRRQYEMVMVAHRTGGNLKWADPDYAQRNVISMMPPRNRLHPNEKPLSLVELFITLHTEPGDTILDPFAGSGTTAMAAEKLGRNSILIEKDPHYCNVIRERMSNLQQTIFSMGGITE